MHKSKSGSLIMLRLFANLWLDDPPTSDSKSLNSVLGLIRDLERSLAQGQ